MNNKVEKLEDFFPPFKKIYIGKNISIAQLKAILFPKQKVIFYQDSIFELKDLDLEQLNKRIYFIYKFKKDGRLYVQHHLEARPDKILGDGPSQIDFYNLQPRYFISRQNFNFAIEGKDFEIKPDGTIVWKF